MGSKTNSTTTYRFTWVALAVSLLSIVLISGVEETSADTSTALWLILLLLIIFVSIPLHGLIIVVSLIQLVQGNGSAFRWVYLYLTIAVVGHAVVAGNFGAFEGIANDISQFWRETEEPGQVKLEKALKRGPLSNILEVSEALASGADPNGAIFDNRMPFLVLVASRADTQAIKVLLDAGADPNRRSSIKHVMKGATVENPSALDIVLFSEYGDVVGSVKLLLTAGSELSIANRSGQYPLDVAIANKHFEAALHILKAGGIANNKNSIEYVLENSSQDSHLEEMREFLFREEYGK